MPTNLAIDKKRKLIFGDAAWLSIVEILRNVFSRLRNPLLNSLVRVGANNKRKADVIAGQRLGALFASNMLAEVAAEACRSVSSRLHAAILFAAYRRHTHTRRWRLVCRHYRTFSSRTRGLHSDRGRSRHSRSLA